MARGKRHRRRRHKAAQQRLHEHALAALQEQIDDQAGVEQRKAEIKKSMDEAMQSPRQLLLLSVRYEVRYPEIKQWCEGLGHPAVYCKVHKGKAAGQSAGRATVTFASPESVAAIMRMATPQFVCSRSGAGATGAGSLQYCLRAPIGYKGQLRVKPLPARLADVADGAVDRDELKITAVQVGNLNMAGVFELAAQLNNEGQEATARLAGRIMQLEFCKGNKMYRAEIPYKAGGKMLIHKSGSTLSLLWPLRRPPKFFSGSSPFSSLWGRFASALQIAMPADAEAADEMVWERVGDFRAKSTTTLSPREQGKPMELAAGAGPLGACYVYRLVLPPSCSLQALRSKNGVLDKLWKYHLLEEFAAPSTVAIQGMPFVASEEGYRLLDVPPALESSPAEVLFHLGCLTSQGYIPSCNLSASLCQAVAEAEEEVVIEVLTRMRGGSKPLADPLLSFQDLKEEVLAAREESQELSPKRRPAANGSMDIKRCLVTPTRIVGLGVEHETSNRVLRAFSEHNARFMRVAFGEEDGNRVMAGGGAPPINLYARMREVLEKGIWVGHWHFQFLAFSSSQLRDQSCWFFAPIDGITPDYIRSWMGDFSRIREVGKYAARMGQCFSMTVDAADVEPQSKVLIPDVERNGYCFTDGCGSISPALAEETARNLRAEGRLREYQHPTAYQIRFSGVKGMVAVDPRLHGRRLCVRPSMEKFQAPHPKLEIIRPAGYMTGYLNRQIVQLLSTLGVQDAVFLRMQDEMARELDTMLSSSAAALRVLTKYRGCIEAPVADALLCMLDAGTTSTDPFVRGILVALRGALLQGLRHKARIYVEKGCSLIGVVDETGTLAPDEVFVCFQRPGSTSPTVLTGPCLLTKNPCFHVGDIRVVQAVDRPELHHRAYGPHWDAPLDVVAFSQHGARPLPNMMAGSDLDGDIYFITWDTSLFPPPARRNMPALNYDIIPPKIVAQVHTSDIQDFFCFFAMNSNLGQIANAWVAWADQLQQGAEDPKCVRLAGLHSQAVDFAKHGQPAIMGPDDRPSRFPDFMQKRDKETYESPKVLGQLYRRVKERAAEAKQEVFALPMAAAAAGEGAFDPDLVLPAFLGSEDFWEEVELAQGARHEYESRLVRLMNQFGVSSEAELLSGCITKWSKYYKRRDTYDLKQQIRDAVRTLWADFQREFEEGLDGPWEGSRPESPDAPAPATSTAPAQGPAAASSSSAAAAPAATINTILSSGGGRGSAAVAAAAAVTTTTSSSGGGSAAVAAGHSRERAALVRAAAWYYSTYHPDCQPSGIKSKGRVRLFSFAWLPAVAQRLAEIKAVAVGQQL